MHRHGRHLEVCGDLGLNVRCDLAVLHLGNSQADITADCFWSDGYFVSSRSILA